jgi:predicted HAD superfamily phosphohydrolase YqeG
MKTPHLITPHVRIDTIATLNYKRMKDMGMEKIIFDKDNTLTYNRRTSFIDPKVADAFSSAVSIFGKPNVIVLSEMTP